MASKSPSSQKSITSFFKRKSVDKISGEEDSKVETKENESGNSMNQPSEEEEPSTPPKAKKAKVDEEEDNSKSLLSPEQKSRMKTNKIESQILLKCKKLPGTLTPTIGQSWFEALLPEFEKESFEKLDNFLQTERKNQTIFPPFEDVWNWTSQFELSETKVVILGQDPYHGPKQAHGLCFSVQKGVSPPPSLVNMYKELESNNEGFKRPSHGDLSGWASQGVLLLNACLTVRQGQPNSHKDKGWEKITDAAIKAVSENCPSGVVFLLWGAFAQKKAALVDSKKHHILKSVHPSPLSAHRGFLGCEHFSKCNQLLEEKGRKPVDWTHLP